LKEIYSQVDVYLRLTPERGGCSRQYEAYLEAKGNKLICVAARKIEGFSENER
jgi:hypothetical protein